MMSYPSIAGELGLCCKSIYEYTSFNLNNLYESELFQNSFWGKQGGGQNVLAKLCHRFAY